MLKSIILWICLRFYKKGQRIQNNAIKLSPNNDNEMGIIFSNKNDSAITIAIIIALKTDKMQCISTTFIDLIFLNKQTKIKPDKVKLNLQETNL